MKGNAALRIAITGANGNIGRKRSPLFLAATDIAAIHAIDRDVASLLPPMTGACSQSGLILRGPVLLDALAGVDARHSFGTRRIPIRTPHGKTRALPLI